MPPAPLREDLIPSDAMILEHSGGMDREAYIRTGDIVTEAAFIGAAGLKPDQRLLDVGCGCGKVARPLSAYLSPQGEYHGIDVGKDCIDWCRQTYREFPNFHFHHADLFSTRYNRGGGSPASKYRFPLPDDHFDLVFLGSVFTHLMPKEVENYLGEIARVLKPGGQVMATYFLLDDESRGNVEAGRASPPFPHFYKGDRDCRVQNPRIPEVAVAYEEAFLRRLYAHIGLQMGHVGRGHWARGDLIPHWQDEVWAAKPRDWTPPPRPARGGFLARLFGG